MIRFSFLLLSVLAIAGCDKSSNSSQPVEMQGTFVKEGNIQASSFSASAVTGELSPQLKVGQKFTESSAWKDEQSGVVTTLTVISEVQKLSLDKKNMTYKTTFVNVQNFQNAVNGSWMVTNCVYDINGHNCTPIDSSFSYEESEASDETWTSCTFENGTSSKTIELGHFILKSGDKLVAEKTTSVVSGLVTCEKFLGDSAALETKVLGEATQTSVDIYTDRVHSLSDAGPAELYNKTELKLKSGEVVEFDTNEILAIEL